MEPDEKQEQEQKNDSGIEVLGKTIVNVLFIVVAAILAGAAGHVLYDLFMIGWDFYE